MRKKSTMRIIGVLAVICMASAFSSVIVGGAFSANALTINKVPTDVVKAEITACDSEHTPIATEATISISNGKAKIDNLSNAGYYYVTFYTDIAEVGSTEFYVGDSGKTYVSTYDDNNSETFKQMSSLDYQKYLTYRVLDISGNNQVKFEWLSDDISNATIHVSYDDGNYGDTETDVNVNDGTTVISDIGGKGDYTIDFMDSSYTTQCFASFAIGDNGETLIYDYTFDDISGEWKESLVETDVVYVEAYDDFMADMGSTEDSGVEAMSVTISGVSKNVTRADVQANDSEMNEMDVEPVISINSGNVEIDNLYCGCYFVNFYNSADDVIGFSKFYLNELCEIYNFDMIDNELQLTPVSSIAYESISTEREYIFGNITVPIYGVPEDIDSVETYYAYGSATDETILFEPDYSSVFVEPFTLSKLGQEGNYKVSFFKDGNVVGNASFHIDSNGKLCEIDYKYNDSTGEWEATLVDAEEIYYYDNTDIEDADTYNYGNIKLTITNVPSDAKLIESSYYENDETFTYGTYIFPKTTFGNGTITISNLGQPGYHEFDLLKADGKTKIGYVFVWIDENLNTYLYETYVNTDVMQLEKKTTKTSTIKLSQYVNGSVEYVAGTASVTIDNVNKTANNILVTVVGENDQYSSFEQKITVNPNGTFTLNKLGMNGDYTITFFNNKEIVGTAHFYLKDNETYEAKYSGDYELHLSKISDIKFIAQEDAPKYGDANDDGEVTVADAVMLQKWLLGESKELTCWQNVDLYEDNRIDVFDLCLLKRLLIEQ